MTSTLSESEVAEPAPVFVDESGRRGRRLRWVGWFFGIAFVGVTLAMISGLLGTQSDAPAFFVPTTADTLPPGQYVDAPQPAPPGKADRHKGAPSTVAPTASSTPTGAASPSTTPTGTASAPGTATAAGSPTATHRTQPAGPSSPTARATHTSSAPASASPTTDRPAPPTTGHSTGSTTPPPTGQSTGSPTAHDTAQQQAQ